MALHVLMRGANDLNFVPITIKASDPCSSCGFWGMYMTINVMCGVCTTYWANRAYLGILTSMLSCSAADSISLEHIAIPPTFLAEPRVANLIGTIRASATPPADGGFRVPLPPERQGMSHIFVCRCTHLRE